MAVSERIKVSDFPPHTGDNYVIRINNRHGRPYWFDWRVGPLYTIEEVESRLEELDHENYEYRVIYANVPPVEWTVVA